MDVEAASEVASKSVLASPGAGPGQAVRVKNSSAGRVTMRAYTPHASQSGVRSSAISASIERRGRVTANWSPRTSTSAGSARVL